MSDGRCFVNVLEAMLERDASQSLLLAPAPGLWRDAPEIGSLVRGGTTIGSLEVLGRLHRLVAPAGSFGVVSRLPEGRRLARRPVGYRTELVMLDPEGVSGGAELLAQDTPQAGAGRSFRTPLGGRYYARPAPDAPPFVNVGDELNGGETIALIEVMKTFNRVRYDGDPGTVKAIVPNEGDDIETGDVLLELETARRLK